MTPNYFNPSSSLPFVEEDQGQDHLHFTPISQPSSSSFHTFFAQTQDHERGFQVRDQKPLQLLKYRTGVQFSATGHSDHQSLASPSSLPVVEERDGCSQKQSICKDEDRDQSESGPIRWMSSKMRMMRKMINSDQVVVDKLINSAHAHAPQNEPRTPPCSDENSKGSSYSNSSNNMIRVCADCNTTKTPLWRSGPQGPKSLCNACGIRQRKARRAMAAAAADAATGGAMTTDALSMNSKVLKDKRSDYTTQHKKRCKLAAPYTKKKLLFDDLTISLSKSLAFHQVFPQDEKEAAILLMAISYGLVNG